MNVFKYHGTLIFDSKKVFNKNMGIRSLEPLTYMIHEDKNIAFSGFVKIGKSLATIPIMLSLDRELGIAYLFDGEGGYVFNKFLINMLSLLKYYGYEIRSIKEDIKRCY